MRALPALRYALDMSCSYPHPVSPVPGFTAHSLPRCMEETLTYPEMSGSNVQSKSEARRSEGPCSLAPLITRRQCLVTPCCRVAYRKKRQMQMVVLSFLSSTPVSLNPCSRFA